MKKLLASADQFLQESDWRDLTLVKFCLCAIGIMIGLCVPKENKKYPFICAGVIFIITYIPLMVKLIKIIIRQYTD